MHCLGGRVLLPELLDHAPEEETRRNLRELVTINRRLGGHRILRDRLREAVSPSETFSFLDVGAASGDMSACASAHYPGLRPIQLDRRALHLERASGHRVVGDAFRLPFRDRAVDISHCSLFLHHFTDDQVSALLAEMWRVSHRAVIVQDLERHPAPYYFLPATKWLFQWSRLVLHDGPISVEAGFRAPELRTLARQAGLPVDDVRTHRPAFRLSFLAMRS